MRLEKGAAVEGKVTGITKYGAFVKLEDGTNGMIHISEISSEFVKDINEHLKLNQTVKAVVIAVDGNGKIALSIKQASGNKNPAESYGKSGSAGTDSKPPPRQNRNSGLNSKIPEEYSRRSDRNSSMGSFEDMMSKFKHDSDEKMSNMKNMKNFEAKKNNFARRKSYQGNNNRDD